MHYISSQAPFRENGKTSPQAVIDKAKAMSCSKLGLNHAGRKGCLEPVRTLLSGNLQIQGLYCAMLAMLTTELSFGLL